MKGFRRKNRNKRHFIYLLLLGMVLPCGLSAQRITGKIIDQETSEPLPAVEISLKPKGGNTISNSDGTFKIDISTGEFILFNKEGYRSLLLTNKVLYNHITISLEKLPSPDIQIDNATRHLIDSINTHAELERLEKIEKILLEGKLPIGKLNMDLQRLFGYNHFEGFKLGMGLETNQSFSNRIQLGGYYQHGFKSKKAQKGGFSKLFFGHYSSTIITASYQEQMTEPGSISFLEERSLNKNTEAFRNFLFEDLYRQKTAYLGLDFRPSQYWRTSYFIEAGSHTNGFAPYTPDFRYDDLNVGVKIHYQYGERLTFNNHRLKVTQGSAPEFMLNLTKGLKTGFSDYNYTSTEIKITDQLNWEKLGNTNFCIIGGKILGDIPIARFYNGAGSYDNFFSIQADHSFATMRFGEFAADQFFSLFIKQNLGEILKKWHGEFFQPGISICLNSGVGSLKNKNATKIQKNSFNKGYYETGILLNNLLKASFVSYGIGVYYRLGYYQLPCTQDNFSLKLSLRFQNPKN